MTEEEYNRIHSTEESKIFKSVVKGVNFITPIILDYKRIGKYIVEISTNRNNEIIGKLYGVTIIAKDRNNKYKRKTILDDSFNTYEEVENYLKQLENE